MSEYQLRTDAFGRKRLDLQGKIYNPASCRFLLEHSIKLGQSILEIGCGSGAMTPFLAELTGKKGRVLAIDISESQVKATEKLVKKANLKQVECKQLSVFDLDELKEKFDVIYVRWVLIHLQDPFLALEKVIKQLKKGGLLVIDEMLNSYSFSFPESPVFAKRRYVLEQFFIRNNLDPNFGLQLKSALLKNKLYDIREAFYQPIVQTKVERQLLTFIFKEVKEKIIELAILKEKELKQMIESLEKMAKIKDNTLAISALYQISARK